MDYQSSSSYDWRNFHIRDPRIILNDSYEFDENHLLRPTKSYDYLLKFLLVGDSDVGKDEILNKLEDDNIGSIEPAYCSRPGVAYKMTTILLDGKRIRLHLWLANINN